MQFGYFTGSLAAGAALAFGGYPPLGLAAGALLASAVVLGGRFGRNAASAASPAPC
jgi:hypothetical protein